MKKITLILTVLTLISAVATTGCKKGENDPGISLRSRKARLTGEWKLVSGKEVDTRVQNNVTYVTTTEYTGDKVINTETADGSVITTSTTSAVLTMTIDKDYSFKMEQKGDGGEFSGQGSWFWLGKNKVEDLKKKEAFGVNIIETTFSFGGQSQSEKTKGFEDVMIFLIDQLKNKEMILTRNSEEADGSTSTLTYTLEKQ